MSDWKSRAVPASSDWKSRAQSASLPDSNISDEAADVAGRFAVKNFGNDTKSSLDYLRAQPENKDLQFSISPDNEIIAKKNGESQWKKLDASGWGQYLRQPGELVKDLTDVAYDVPAGAAAGLATGLSAASGMPIIGGAASNAASEALRQQIGKWLGVNNNIDLGSVGLSGAIGGLGAKIFGGGATNQMILKKLTPDRIREVLTSEGVQVGPEITDSMKNMAKDIVKENQASILKYAPKVGQFFSGIGSDTISGAGEQAPEQMKEALGFAGQDLTNLQATDLMKKQGTKAPMDALAKSLENGVDSYDKDLKARWGAALRDSGDEVDVNAAVEPMIKDTIDLIKEQSTNIDPKTGEKSISLSRSDKNVIARLRKFVNDTLYIKNTVELPDGTTQVVRVPKGAVSPEESMRIEQKLASELKGNLGENVPHEIKSALYNANKSLSSANDAIVNSMDDGLVQEYKKWQADKEILAPFFEKGPIGFFQKLKAAGGKNKRVLMETLQDINLRHPDLPDFKKVGQSLDVQAMFENPSFDPVTGQGSTSTSRTMSAAELGAALGRIFGKGGEAAGRAMGGKLISPAFIKTILKGQQAVEGSLPARAASGLTDYIKGSTESMPLLQQLMSGAAYQAPVQKINDYRRGAK